MSLERTDLAARRLRSTIDRHPTGRVTVHATDLRLALDRIATLEHVAAGNKRHVQLMYRDLLQAQKERDAAVAELATRPAQPRTAPEGLSLTDMLAAVLADAGMSQVELARRTGLSTKHVSQIATGKVALSIAIALRFEAALGVDAAEWMRAEVARRRGVAGPLVLEAVEA